MNANAIGLFCESHARAERSWAQGIDELIGLAQSCAGVAIQGCDARDAGKEGKRFERFKPLVVPRLTEAARSSEASVRSTLHTPANNDSYQSMRCGAKNAAFSKSSTRISPAQVPSEEGFERFKAVHDAVAAELAVGPLRRFTERRCARGCSLAEDRLETFVAGPRGDNPKLCKVLGGSIHG